MKNKTKKYLISILEERKKSYQRRIDNRIQHDKIIEANIKINPEWYTKYHYGTYKGYLKWSTDEKNNMKNKILEIDKMIDEIKEVK